MSDFLGAIFGGGEEFEKRLDQAEMQSDENAHRLYRVIDTLTQEQKEVVRDLVLTASLDGGAVGRFFAGYLTSRLESDDRICPACRKNHHEELHQDE